MLEDKRIYLRPINEHDAESLYQWGKDPLYHETAGFERISDIQQARQTAMRYSQRPYSFAIILKKTQQMIGLVELYERGMDEKSGLLATKDLGFLLDKNYWRQGLMHDALHLVINYAFNDLKQNQIWAGTFPSNERSQHLLHLLGFRYVYTTDYNQLAVGTNFQEKYFLLTPQDWYDTMHINTKS
ncbi:GNAT family N-acetyltransferase [Lactobacillus hominis]|uniref:Acetyltransferase, including N-acetylase of ribosomal protein n=1 Tax=Lactobacillus hominis DSM 23910 = CRBIP 24.179 TaxID=1423758 RepID=I7L5N1_9LACO|nr:GNAT family N-acetyltransferase [Lactobacillus hominis]KRM84724.1 acetyltransferase [Lactobacillus hominis DSM 23910 = CRBIP 24.179]MCT3348260.1 N-acetyltransferase [Lactobacillus hominis]CCI81492.1 Acetyltransferase, including N-acetylase of ribosomal protein [Lactobacillus hominis DSM 23910 = CRBIP 24.179]